MARPLDLERLARLRARLTAATLAGVVVGAAACNQRGANGEAPNSPVPHINPPEPAREPTKTAVSPNNPPLQPVAINEPYHPPPAAATDGAAPAATGDASAAAPRRPTPNAPAHPTPNASARRRPATGL